MDAVVCIPELKGTTEEKGEYGNASSTVRSLPGPLLTPFGVDPLLPAPPLRGALYPLVAILTALDGWFEVIAGRVGDS